MDLVIEPHTNQHRYCDLIRATGIDRIPAVEDFTVTAVRDGWMSRVFVPDFTTPSVSSNVIRGEEMEATHEAPVDPGVGEASAEISTKVRPDHGDRSWVDVDAPHLLGQRLQEATTATVDGYDPHCRIDETFA